MSYKGANFKSQWLSKKDTIKERSRRSNTNLGDNNSLGDAEIMEKEVFKDGGNFTAVKSIVYHSNDKTLRVMNTNIEEKNYENDPLYIYMRKLEASTNNDRENWPVNYYHFITGITHKIQNRTLKSEDYNLLWNVDKGEINQEVFERYRLMQSRYKVINADVSFSSIFDNHTPNWELSGFFGSGHELINISEDKGLKESLEYLEKNIQECEKMYSEGVNSVDIGLFLSNNDYKKVIDLKKVLGEFGKFHYAHINGEHIFYVSDSGKKISSGEILQDLINDFISKKWVFNQIDKLENLNLGEYYKSHSEKMYYVLSQYDSYRYLNDFWFGENKAYEGFKGPNSGYGLSLVDTFQHVEYETSARILMKLMAENGNKWEIPEEKVKDTTRKNLLACNAITIEDGIVSFTNSSITKIGKRYEEQKNEAIQTINELKVFFNKNSISLPN